MVHRHELMSMHEPWPVRDAQSSGVRSCHLGNRHDGLLNIEVGHLAYCRLTGFANTFSVKSTVH